MEISDMAMPEWALGTIETPDGREVMILELHTASVTVSAVLATKENYRQVADRLAEGIRRMGAEMKTVSPLITNVKELPDGLRNRTPEGG